MCDSFVALPPATTNQTVIFGKSADCQINEAHALVRFPHTKHVPGEAFRATHRVIPQAAETNEVILSKSFWTWGAEIGMNEYGVSIGNEAVYTTLQKEEKSEGLMVIDMLRLGLERGKTAREAVQAIAAVLEEFGQGGNCELAGNSHFDGSYLIVDPTEAWVLETAGRQWAAKRLTDCIGSISNVLSIGDDWDLSSLKERKSWAETYGDPSIVPQIGSCERQACTYDGLSASKGNISVRTAFNVLRQHPEGYHPAMGEVHTNICMHAGPPSMRQWQATGAMVTEASVEGIMGWCTASSGTCVSIFKPVFLGVELPDIGPIPTEQYDPHSLWWKHELLHRRAMADFDGAIPEIRKEFDALEDEFLGSARSVLKDTPAQKKDFMEHCFQKAEQATESWIQRLSARTDLTFSDLTYRAMWEKFNRQARLTNMPA
jgi:dipeptidase